MNIVEGGTVGMMGWETNDIKEDIMSTIFWYQSTTIKSITMQLTQFFALFALFATVAFADSAFEGDNTAIGDTSGLVSDHD